MSMRKFWQNYGTWLIIAGILALLSWIGFTTMGQLSFIRTMLSGLTLGSLYFMVAAGLTLIFGLMDVLNFAHGAMFMVGAYLGWQFYTNPTFLFGLAPLVCALLAGMVTANTLRPFTIRWNIPEAWQSPLRKSLNIAGIIIGVVAAAGLDFIGLAETALVSAMVAANPLAEATPQEALNIFWYRPVLMLVAGTLLALAASRPGDKTQVTHGSESRRSLIFFVLLLALTVLLTLVRESAPIAVLQMDRNLRFFLALIVGTGLGAGLGAVIEMSLIRPLYDRLLYQVLVTLGLSYVLRETVQLLWSPIAYQMDRPPLFSGPGKAASIWEWFSTNNTTIDVWGVTFPSYRLFIIFLGILMLIALGLTMKYSRLGMIIRAGVQDRTMVEALGINVRRVFTIVFMLGASLAALGGIGAAPFIPVTPLMGDTFQLQAFIVVVIGGMGSYSGAAIGALLLGLARAFGDFLALKFQLTPAIAEASMVIIMAIILLVRPAGLFGKKE